MLPALGKIKQKYGSGYRGAFDVGKSHIPLEILMSYDITI